MHWTFAASLEFTISFLESSFKQDPRFAATTANTDDTQPEFFSSNNHNHDGDESSKQQKLDHAYKFMELTPPVTQEELKKKYKRLSLRYHPDRNGGSEESQKQMQILNACMEMIEKDLAGVDGEDGVDHDDHHHDDDEDGHDDEDPMEKYKRMRKEREEAMAAEMKRQEQMRQAFVNNKDRQKEECAKRSQELKLDTFEGRDKANKHFVQEVEKSKATSTSSEDTSQPSSDAKANSMDDIDDDNHTNNVQKSQEESKSYEEEGYPKPKNEVMECNSNDFAIALRMNLPDIAINVIQNQIRDFFKESALTMHFEGETKTPSQLKLEFLQNPIDDDGNTMLHYACYYESYQTIKVVCKAALEAATKQRAYGDFEAVLTQKNYHNQTPYYFVNVAQDQSISKLMESQLDISKIIKQRTMFFPALAASGKRILGIFQHIGIVTTLTTILAFVTAHIGFDLSNATSFLALVLMQVLGKNLPGVRGVSVFLAFCLLWKLAIFVYVEFLKEYIMIELVLVLAPIVLAGLISSRRKHWLLLPLRAYQQISIRLSKVLNYITPKAVAKRGMTQLFFLSITMLILFGLKQAFE